MVHLTFLDYYVIFIYEYFFIIFSVFIKTFYLIFSFFTFLQKIVTYDYLNILNNFNFYYKFTYFFFFLGYYFFFFRLLFFKNIAFNFHSYIGSKFWTFFYIYYFTSIIFIYCLINLIFSKFITSKKYKYLFSGKKISLTLIEFFDIWSWKINHNFSFLENFYIFWSSFFYYKFFNFFLSLNFSVIHIQIFLYKKFLLYSWPYNNLIWAMKRFVFYINYKYIYYWHIFWYLWFHYSVLQIYNYYYYIYDICASWLYYMRVCHMWPYFIDYGESIKDYFLSWFEGLVEIWQFKYLLSFLCYLTINYTRNFLSEDIGIDIFKLQRYRNFSLIWNRISNCQYFENFFFSIYIYWLWYIEQQNDYVDLYTTDICAILFSELCIDYHIGIIIVMFLVSILALTFFISSINMWYLSYIGVFVFILINLLICFILVWWFVYYIWLNSITLEYLNFFWLEIGNNLYVFWNFRYDIFSIVLSFIVVSAALLVCIFVYIDMWDDKEGVNFVITLGFFIFFMLVVIGSGNLMLFYLGWEGIGLTSLFLINFWTERVRSLKATFKVFLINKIGDFFVLIYLCYSIIFFGDLNFDFLNVISINFISYCFNLYFFNFNIIDFFGILIILGGSVKSAQYGFHIWLLEAMEAPLGASALMHSSTLVVAGFVYIYKLSSYIDLSLISQFFMFILGIFSATIGSLIAVFQYELKTIMAYSTISNMGYMFLLFSLGSNKETLLIIILHAYIKIMMFLIVGGLMLHCNGSQDVRNMGGLFLYTPFLLVSYLIGGVCLIGLPYWTGYYYKTAIWQYINEVNIFLKGGEYLIFLSYISTIFYVLKIGFTVFFISKNGHKSVYKIKPTSLFYSLNLFILSTFIIFGNYFWINFIDNNIFFINNSIFFVQKFYCNYVVNELTFYAVYLWIFIYLIITLIIALWYFWGLNFYWNILKNWCFFIFIINFCFLYYVIS